MRNRALTPEEQSQSQFTPYVNPETGQYVDKPLLDASKRRENQISQKGSNLTPPFVGLEDIDQALQFYFENVIKPTVIERGSPIPVPVLYATPERWKSMQSDGAIRDKNGKIITPVILCRRTAITKNRMLGNKVGAVSPAAYQVFTQGYSKRNIYDRFNVLNNRVPEQEYYTVVIPDFVDITYECIINTAFISQSNKIIEAINYASDTYWGDVNRFQFRTMIDSYTTSVEMADGSDRISKTTFTIQLKGFVIPETVNAQVNALKKGYSKTKITFDVKTS